jgi:FdhD protein
MDYEKHVDMIEVLKCTQNGFINATIPVAKEIPLTVYLNDQEIVTLLCVSEHLKSLAIGFLKSEGLIKEREGVTSISLDEASRSVRVRAKENTHLMEKWFTKKTIGSSGARGSSFDDTLNTLATQRIKSDLRIKDSQVLSLMEHLTTQSDLFKLTRGTHNSALATVDDILLFRSDIGRHNTLDKIYGECLLKGIRLDDKVLLTTGRISLEMLTKSVRMGIPILISHSAATSLAISIANQIEMTLIGYVRAESFFVYTSSERVMQTM